MTRESAPRRVGDAVKKKFKRCYNAFQKLRQAARIKNSLFTNSRTQYVLHDSFSIILVVEFLLEFGGCGRLSKVLSMSVKECY